MTASKTVSGSECLLPGSNPPTGHTGLFLTVLAPCPWINSNQRLHRMVTAKLTAAWREAGRAAAEGVPAFTEPVRVLVHIWKPRRGRYDAGNLYPTAKAVLDGIVSAGVLVDDSNEYVIGPDMRHGGTGPAQIILEIVPATTP